MGIDIVALLGKSGCGKSTVGKQMAKLGWGYVSTGDLARQMAEKNPLIDDELSVGNMAPESQMRQAVKDWLAGCGHTRVIIDGMPRKSSQVEFLSQLSEDVTFILFDITDELATERLRARMRDDDTAATISIRLEFFNKNIAKIKKAAKDYALFTVDGSRPSYQVLDQVLEITGG